MSTEVVKALEAIEREKGISRKVLVEAVEAAILAAYKRNYNSAQNVEIFFNEKTGTIKVFAKKQVVEEVKDARLEISLEQSRAIHPYYIIGDMVDEEVTPKDFGRVAAQSARNIVTQRIREEERSLVYNEFAERQTEIIQAIVQRVDAKNVYVSLNTSNSKTEAILPLEDQIRTETYKHHERFKVCITKVEKTSKGPNIFVSRTHPDLLKRLLELEVDEIREGIVELKEVVREPGERSKIAVYCDNPQIDPVGACVGLKGERVQNIVKELNGEKIDVVKWSEDPVEFVANALSPSKVVDVIVNVEAHSTLVIVPDYQLSLAIGKRGQNARLAAKLTKWKIDIKSESEAIQSGIVYNAQAFAEEFSIFESKSNKSYEGDYQTFDDESDDDDFFN